MSPRQTYKQALAALEEQRAALLAEVAELDPLIAGMKKLVARDNNAAPASAAPRADQSAFRPGNTLALTRFGSGDDVGPYANMELIEAAKTYLLTSDQPRSSRELADALVAGGFKTRSKDFLATATTMLKRPNAHAAGIRRDRSGNWYVDEAHGR